MKSPEARSGAAELGLNRFTYYFHGRGGVLGDVGPTVLTAVFGFFPAPFVRDHWDRPAVTEAGPKDPLSGLDPRRFTAHYAATAHAWARRLLAGFDQADAETLSRLLASVADNADDLGSPLFAGWREVARPERPVERVVQLAHVLREHRGNLHLTAIRALGLTPVQATLTRDNGLHRARFLGWPEPFGQITDQVRERREAAERLTDQLAAPAYAVLSDAEHEQLVTLLRAAYELAHPRHLATFQPAAVSDSAQSANRRRP